MGAAWFDPAAASAAISSWKTWGDRLEVDSRAIQLQLDSLGLYGWTGGTGLLDTAGDRLWTLAAFVAQVRGAVLHADAVLPTTEEEVDMLWRMAASLVAAAAGHRDAIADAAAYERWLDSLEPAAVRAMFESEHGSDPTRTLAALTGADAIAYWNALPPRIQSDLVETRPDLVVLRVVAAGAELPASVLAALDAANAYQRFSEQFAVDFEVAVNARVVAIEIGGGFTAVTSKLSDGTVELTLVADANVGVGFDLDIPRAVGAGATVGLFGEVVQRFRFTDEDTASDAIRTLRDAASEDASFGELVQDGGSVVWNTAVAPWNGVAGAANWLVPFVDPVPEIPTFDMTPETLKRLQEMWQTNGLISQVGGGVYADVGAEFEAALGTIEAELDATAEARLMFYDTDVAVADTTGAVGQTGVMFSGVVSVDVDGELDGLGHDLAGHAAGEAGFVVDLHHTDDDETFLTLTLMTSVAAGEAVELIDLGPVELDTTVDGTAAMTVTYTVAVDDRTSDAVGDIGRALAVGNLPMTALRDLHDAAEIDVTITTGTNVSNQVEIEAAIVEAEVTVSQANETTQVALHKYPDGTLFSRIDVDRLIDAAAE